MSKSLTRITHEPLWGRAHTQLREALLAGKFEPGSSLTLRELAESFGISITPVRDAVSRLVAQGVLTQGARNSAMVPTIDATTFRHILLVRTELEGRAAREAALRADPSSIDHLEKHLSRMREQIASRDLDSYLMHHRWFHFRIYQMADIPLLLEMIENLWLRCGPVLSFVLPEYVLTLKGTDHHLAVLDALRNQDGDTAEREIIADIEEAGSYLLSLADAKGRMHRPVPAQNHSTR